MTSCVFCRIIAGTLPAHVIYEDDQVIGILDHRPIRPGHCMIIPKQHFDYFTNLPEDLAAHIVRVGNDIGRKMLEVLKPPLMRIGFVVHGFVPHVHYHVIPQHDEDDITSGVCAGIKDGKVIFNAESIPLADNAEQIKIAALMRK